MTEKDANIHFSITGADVSKQDLKGIRDETEKIGPAGKQGAQGLTDAFANVERASLRVTQKISEGRAVTVRDGNAIIQSFESLKREIESTFGSIEKAPLAVQQGFAKAEAQFRNTTATVKAMTTATKENQQAILGNTAQWNGWEQQLLKMTGADGALGKIIIGLAGVAAAFTAGVAAGDKLNKIFGTDVSEWESATEEWGKKVGLVVRDIADVIGKAASAIFDLLTGNFRAAMSDAQEMSTNVIKLGRDVGAAATMGTAEWNKYVIAQNDARFATKSAAEGAAKLREEHNKLEKAISDLNKELKKENDELSKQKVNLEDADIGLANSTSELGRYKRQVDEGNTALQQQRDKIKDLSEKFGESSLLVKQAKEEEQRLQEELGRSQRKLEETKAEVSRYGDQQKTAQGAINELTKAHKTHEDELKKLQTEYKNVSTALGDHEKKANDVAKAHGAIALNAANAKIAVLAAKEPVEGLTKVFGEAAVVMEKVDGLLTSIAGKLQAIAGIVGPAIDAFNNLGAAAAKAAGDERSQNPEGFKPN